MGIDLGKVTTEVKEIAPGIVIYSLADLGKSTFLARLVKDVPDSILFQCGESSLSNLLEDDQKGVPHYPDIIGGGGTPEEICENYLDFCDLLMQLDEPDECPYTLIAFDNIDNIINFNMSDYVIENFYEGDMGKANGWGNKKVVEMVQQTSLILQYLTSLRSKGVTIVLSLHSRIIPHTDPLGEEYDTYSLALPTTKRASVTELFVNWATQLMFGTLDVVTAKNKDSNNKKATAGQRVLMCAPHPAYVVKNKFRLPDKFTFDYDVFKKYMWGEPEEEKKVIPPKKKGKK